MKISSWNVNSVRARIINILKYAGVVIKDPEVVQLATQEAAKVEQNEKS